LGSVAAKCDEIITLFQARRALKLPAAVLGRVISREGMGAKMGSRLSLALTSRASPRRDAAFPLKGVSGSGALA